jgi:malate dehydrogenase (oxaloacetate-decarboxylating)(NADP+)
MNYLVLADRQISLVDTHINLDPSAAELVEITLLAAQKMRYFGLIPHVALVSHSNFGSNNSPSAQKMRDVLALLRETAPGLEVEGEIHGDTALDFEQIRRLMPDSPLTESANLLVMPSLESANIAYNLLKATAGNGIAIGPVLLGCAKPVHILTAYATVRRIVNMTALCVVDAIGG